MLCFIVPIVKIPALRNVGVVYVCIFMRAYVCEHERDGWMDKTIDHWLSIVKSMLLFCLNCNFIIGLDREHKIWPRNLATLA